MYKVKAFYTYKDPEALGGYIWYLTAWIRGATHMLLDPNCAIEISEI